MERIVVTAAAVAIGMLAAACSDDQATGVVTEGLLTTATASNASVDPTLVSGNPTCGDIAGGLPVFEFKIDGSDLTQGGGLFTVTPGATGHFDWAATGNSHVTVFYVIAKGGDAANVYDYTPDGATSDTDLVTPTNASAGPAAISHVTFCYAYVLDVSKTAVPFFQRDHDWSIAKDAGVDTISTDEVTTLNYAIELTYEGYVDSDFALSGAITVANPHPAAAHITGVEDAFPGLDGTLSLDCTVGETPVESFPYDLAAGATMVCAYSGAFNAAPVGDDPTENTATVTTDGSNAILGGSATAPFDFDEPTTENDACAYVSDYALGIGPTKVACAGDVGVVKDVPITLDSGSTGFSSLDVSVLNLAMVQAALEECTGSYAVQFVNVAAVFGDPADTAPIATGSDSIEITGSCSTDGGDACTLTQGFWKTHSSYGPATPESWDGIGADPDEDFFGSGTTWYDLFWMPVQGNAAITGPSVHGGRPQWPERVEHHDRCG